MATVNTNLNIKFNVCEQQACKWLEISDTTGVYNITTNPGGWDSTATANPSAANVTETVITVVDPNGVTFTFSSDTTPPFPIDTLPDPTGLDIYVIPNTRLGLTSSDKLTDGLYDITITYTGTFGANDYTATSAHTILVTCVANCCIGTLTEEIVTSDCVDCENSKIDLTMLASTLLDNAKKAAACGKRLKAKRILKAVQAICRSKNCLNCS